MILNRAPYGEQYLSPEPLEGPVDETPTKFPNRAPTENDVRPLSPPPHVLLGPRNGVPLTELPQREMLPFQSPSTIS